MYIIVREGENPEKYFAGWQKNGRPLFRTKHPKRFLDEDEAKKHAKWIPYMSYRVTKVKIVKSGLPRKSPIAELYKLMPNEFEIIIS